MRLVKAAKASPHAKFYSLSTDYNSHLKTLIILQNKAVKIVAGGQRHDHVTPFYHRLQILKLKGLVCL